MEKVLYFAFFLIWGGLVIFVALVWKKLKRLGIEDDLL